MATEIKYIIGEDAAYGNTPVVFRSVEVDAVQVSNELVNLSEVELSDSEVASSHKESYLASLSQLSEELAASDSFSSASSETLFSMAHHVAYLLDKGPKVSTVEEGVEE